MPSKAPRSLVSAAVAAALVAGVLYLHGHRRADHDPADPSAHPDDGAGPALLFDRVWVDSKPEKYTDYVNAFLAVGGAPIGLFHQASAYRATTELYEYQRDGNRLTIHFPQTDRRQQVTFRISRCADLSPFDLCLDLSQNPWGGPRRYYGLSDSGQEQQLLGPLRHDLEDHVRARPPF